MIIRVRGQRPEWVPIPFIPAQLFEQIFYQKAQAAIEFSTQYLGLTFPCEIEIGLIDTQGVSLAFNDNMREIRAEKIIEKRELSNPKEEIINDALLAFFEKVHDATGFARPKSLFSFPPNPPNRR